MTKEPLILVSTRLPIPLVQRLRAEAQREGRSIQALVKFGLQDYLNRKGRPRV